ncbi:MAG: hypothetical protein JWM21_4214 [Acidobacteria bacterium]|nr:hypothetical protein [Acidobacteriota bacterium]
MKTQILRIILGTSLALFALTPISTKAQKAELVVQTGHSSGVMTVAFSPDGKILASGSMDNTINLWEVESGKELRMLRGHSTEIRELSFSEDGKFLASRSLADTVKIWNTASGKELTTFEERGVWSITLSPDGKTVALGNTDGTIKLRDAASGKELRTLKGHPFRNYIQKDITNTHSQKYFVPSAVWSLAFSPDGKTLASGAADQTIKIWNADSGKELSTLTGHSDIVGSVAFSRDGKILASGSYDQTIRIWSLGNGTVLRTLTGHTSQVGPVAFAPDGKTLASSDEKTIRIWDVESGKALRTLTLHSDSVGSVAFSPDGKTLASISDATIKIWNIENEKELNTLRGLSLPVTSVAFSRDGKNLEAGSTDEKLWVWNMEGEQEPGARISHSDSLWTADLGTLTGNDAYGSVAFSPDRRTFAVTAENEDGTIHIWSRKSRKELRSFIGQFDVVVALAFSPDGKMLASGSMEQTVKIWNPDTGEELRTFTGHSSTVSSIAFSSDGKTLASGSLDTTIKLWDLESGKELRTLTGHSADVVSVVFSPDRRFLASGSNDGKAKLWDVATGKEICSLIALDNGDWVVTTPEGRFDTNNIEDSKGLHWVVSDDPFKPIPLEIFMRDYYEPQLLPRLIKCNRAHNCDEEFKTVRDISKLNRVQPPVEIKNVSLPDADGYVDVTVEVGKGQARFAQEDKEVSRTSDVYDLRLFRNGQMVAYWPYDGAQKLLDQTASDLKVDANLGDKAQVEKEGRDWQKATRVELDADGRKTLTTRVRLPRGKDLGKTELTAYGFNEDRVKSRTGKWVWPAEVIAKLPKAHAIKPRAYVITIGVNASQNPNWSLKYAVNDALKMRDTLSAKLKQLKQSDGSSARYDVVAFPLVSDYNGDSATLKSNDATKQKIRAVFDLLAGRKVEENLLAELLANVPQVSQLRKAEPDDLILISFSSHGYTDRNGNFFILPYDIGSSSGITPDLLARCISSEELSFWLRDVDAGDMVIVIDACHAAAVTGKGFKPGPMASRGLGQLAYDKGMRILTATQANDFALESGSLGQGLLSYALVENGLKEGRADFKPRPDGKITMNEWLEYGAAQVPALYDQVKRRNLKAVGRGARAVIIGKKQRGGYQQRPSLFDFARKRADITISVKPAANLSGRTRRKHRII